MVKLRAPTVHSRILDTVLCIQNKMKTIVPLLFFVLIASGNALRCYHCESDKENGCKKESKPEEIKCGTPAVNYQIVCSYKAFYESHGNHHKVISGCETIPSHSPIDPTSINNCEDEKGIFNVKECRICKSDLCNSASLIDTSLLMRLLLPLTYVIAYKNLFF
ncbi:hypothetical protein FQR65_LT01851 [Abscondita terminalis]|nr:hypothetical protein FQR65_LT01851 [Abscondita terminalis]